MANEQNLVPFTSDQSHDEAVKNGRKGGKRSGESRRAKRDAREAARQILSFKPELPEEVLETMRMMGMRRNLSPDMRYVATLAIMQKAMKGDYKSYKFLVEMAGETSEASMLDAKADEIARRSAYAAEERSSAEIDGDDVRQRMSEMSDEELEQYERLCAMFDNGGDET